MFTSTFSRFAFILVLVCLAGAPRALAIQTYSFIKAKGTGSVTLTINGSSTTLNFNGPTNQWNEPTFTGLISGTPVSAIDGSEYHCSVSSSGVTDYVISFQSAPQTRLYVKRRITINDRQVDAITRSEIVGGQFRLKVDYLANAPFGVMDDSLAGVQKRLIFGMGADSADTPGGILMYQRGTHLGGVPSMKFHRSPGTLFTFSNSNRIQARSSFGFLDATLSGSTWTIRYFKDRGPGNPFPKVGDFYEFTGATPFTTYQVEATSTADAYPHPDPAFTLGPAQSLTITRTVGNDTRVREIQTTKYTRRVLTAAYYEGGYPYQYWTERYMNFQDHIVRTWPWRRTGVARGALTETTVKITFEEVIQQGPAGYQVNYHPTFIVEKRLDGSTHGSPVLAQERKGYNGIMILQFAEPPTGRVGGTPSQELSLGGFAGDTGPGGAHLPGGSRRTDARGGQTFSEVFRRPTILYPGNMTPGQPLGAFGKTKESRVSFGDNPLGSASDLITSYDYVDLWDGVQTLPWRVVTRQNGVEIGREETTYTVGSFGGNETVLATRVKYAGAGQPLTTVTRTFSPRVVSIDLRDKVLSETRPDYSRVSHAYQRGLLWNGTWYPHGASTPPTTTIAPDAHFLVATLTGKTGSSVTTFTPSGGTAIAVDGLDMEGHRSLVSETIYDSLGNSVREATYLYTGSGFALLDATYHTYDALGRLTLSASDPTVGSTTRVYREVNYNDSSGNLTWNIQWERDAAGVKTVLTYDDSGRVRTYTREASGTPGQSDYIPASTKTVTYDGADRIVREELSTPGESEILVTEYTYDVLGRRTSVTSPGGYRTTTNYDSLVQTTTIARGRLPVTQPQNSVTVETVWKDGRKKSTSGNAVPDITYQYAYDSSGYLHTTETLATGAWTRTVTDWIGRVVRIEKPTWAASGATGTIRVEKYDYNTLGQLTATGSWQGATLLAPRQLREYDAYGRLLREGIDSNNNGAIDTGSDMNVVQHHFMYETRQMGWFDTGSPINTSAQWYLFEAELVWPYSPDVEAGAADRSNEWTSGSQRYRQVSGLTKTVSSHEFSHDGQVNWTQTVVEVDRATQRTIAQTYVQGSNVRPRSIQRAGFEVEQRNAQGQVTLRSYDGFGRPIAVSEQRISTPTTYDYITGTALVEAVTAPDGKTTTFGYDLLGRKNRETNSAGKISWFRYDEAGNLTHTWGDVPQPVWYEYNDNKQRVAMHTYRAGTWTGESLPGSFSTTSHRDTTTWTYHAPTGLMERKTDALGNFTRYQFDALGRIVLRRDPRGDSWITTYEYYGLSNSNLAAGEFQGSLRRVDYSDPVGTSDVTYTYERRGRVRTVTDASGTRAFNYYDSWTSGSATEARDRSRLLQAETLPAWLGGHVVRRDYQFTVAGRANGLPSAVEINSSATYRVAYGYDATLRLASVQYMADTPFNYDYLPGANLVDTVRQGAAGAYTYLRDLDYESQSNRLTRVLHRARAGSTGDAQQVESHLGYNNLGLRSTDKTRGQSYHSALGRSTWGTHAGYTYNDRMELGQAQRWTMDAAWNPVSTLSDAHRSFAYDPIGNRTSDQAGSYTPGATNRYSATPYGSAPAYDAAGNMTSDGLGRTYEYDGESRLTRITRAGAWIAFTYDYMGRRIGRTSSSGEVVRYIYDGWNVIAEINGSGAIVRQFAWGLDITGSLQGGGGIGGLLVINQTGTRLMPFYDASFNVLGLYDGAGAQRAAYEYDPFGNLVRRAGDLVDANPYRHATKYTDPQTEILMANGSRSYVAYYGHRFYHTAFGRFVNRDPIEETGGLNLYGFCGNDGVNRWDYLGHQDVVDRVREEEEKDKPKDSAKSPSEKAGEDPPTTKTTTDKPGDTVEEARKAEEEEAPIELAEYVIVVERPPQDRVQLESEPAILPNIAAATGDQKEKGFLYWLFGGEGEVVQQSTWRFTANMPLNSYATTGSIEKGERRAAQAVTLVLGPAGVGRAIAGRSVTQIAREGGRHAGFLRNYLNRHPDELRKGIVSLRKEIATHQKKIRDPESVIPNFRQLDPRQQRHLLEKQWPADIKRQREQLEILRELLGPN